MTTAAPEHVDVVDEAPTYDPEQAPKLDAQALAKIESLALDPAQTSFTAEQYAVLESLGWDMKRIRPVHAVGFIYFCQGHGVDPFMREAMLFMTDEGPVNILMIGGFRRQAMRTGEYRGLDEFEFMDEDGDWHGGKRGWSPKWGRPVACRTFAHRAGWVRTEGMVYTEEVEVYEWVQRPGSAERVKRLTERWKQGSGLMGMLQKCAEAAALRRTFPRELDGFYVPEEMERLRENRKTERLAEEAQRGAQARAERFPEPERPVRETRDETVHEGVVIETGREVTREQSMAAATRLRQRAQVVPPEAETPPVEDVPAPVEEERPVVDYGPSEPMSPEMAEDVKVDLLRAELAFQAEIFGLPAEALTRRWVAEYGAPLDGWDSTMLLRVVALQRPDVAAEMSEDPERWQQATVYARVEATEVGPLDRLLGLV